MPKTTATAPFVHPTTGEPVAAGAEVTLSDEDYAALRASGTVTASEAEQKANATPEAEGNYSARATRPDTAPDEPKAPKAPEEPDKEKRR